VDEAEKGRRLTTLIDLQQRLSAISNDATVGRTVEVLVEGRARRDKGQLHGKSPHFKTVVFDDDGTTPGDLRRVRVIAATPLTLIGVPAREELPVPLVSIS
jgi:tRNA A37 methylthiotransferase MiaB